MRSKRPDNCTCLYIQIKYVYHNGFVLRFKLICEPCTKTVIIAAVYRVLCFTLFTNSPFVSTFM